MQNKCLPCGGKMQVSEKNRVGRTEWGVKPIYFFLLIKQGLEYFRQRDWYDVECGSRVPRL